MSDTIGAKSAPVLNPQADKAAGQKIYFPVFPYIKKAEFSQRRSFDALAFWQRTGKDGLAAHIQAVRDADAELKRAQLEGHSATDIKKKTNQKKKLKDALPNFTPHCSAFRDNEAKDENALELTGVFFIDFDANQLGHLSAANVRECVKNSPHVIFAALSPSGGLRVLLRGEYTERLKGETIADFQKAHYHSAARYVVEYIETAIGEPIPGDSSGRKYDTSVVNAQQKCFLTYDPHLYADANKAPFQTSREQGSEKTAGKKQRSTKASDALLSPAQAFEGAEAEAAAYSLIRAVKVGQGGGRSDKLWQYACDCKQYGLSLFSAIKVVERIDNEFHQPPEGLDVVTSQVRSAYSNESKPFGNEARLLADTIRRGQDIARWEKERQAKRAGATLINSEFIDAAQIAAIAASPARVVLVESVQGTGKTTAIKKITAQTTATGRKVVYVAHRVALLRQMADALRLAFYKTVGSPEWLKAPSLVITPNSLHRLTTDLYAGAVVIIDEVDQVFADLCGKTCRKKRLEILGALHRLLNGASRVYAMSADITQPVKKLFAARGDTVEFFRNEWRQTRTAQQYKQAPDLLAALMADVKNGQRVAAACDSKARAKRIHRILTDAYPLKNFLLITEENSQSEAVQKLITDPRGFAAFDGVVYSPALGSGVDIDIDFSPVMYLFAGGGSSSAPELLQMACRFRRWNTLRFWVTPKTLRGRARQPVTRDEVLNIWQRNLNDFTGLYYPDIDTGKPQPLDGYTWAVNLAADVEAEKNDSRNDLAAAFAYVLREKGYSIKTADAEAVSEPEREQASAAEKDARKVLKAEYVAAVLDPANDIDETEADRLDKDGLKSEADRVKLDRFRYKRTAETDDAATLEKAVAVSVETLRERVNAFSTFHDLPADIAERDKATHTGFLPDHRFDALKAQVRQTVEAELRFLSEPGREFFTDSETQAAEVRGVIERHRDSISRRLFVVSDAMLRTPALFLRTFYGQAGLSLATRKQGKDRARVYRIDADALAFMRGIYDRRRERLAQAEAARRAAAENPFDWL